MMFTMKDIGQVDSKHWAVYISIASYTVIHVAL